jgi:flagellar biosynthesis/type III secretory pathway protein FliH
MNTLAKVFRSDNAAAVLAFRPDELGTSSPPSAGSHAFQFPALELVGNFAPVAKTNGHGTHDHTFPEIADLPVEIFPSESENNALEKAVREKNLQETRAAAEAEMNAQIGSLREDLTETISRVSGLANEITGKLEMEVVELALEIARKVVAREVSIDQEVVLSVTKNALSKLHTRTLASIHLHPEDLSYVQEHRSKLNFHGSLELIEDGLVTRGGCLIHTDTGDIDGRIESQFDEITNGLLGNGAEQ